MKKLFTLAALTVSTLCLSAKTFEGYIFYQMTSGKDTMEMQYALKGDKMRVEMNTQGHKSIGLFDATTGGMHILMPEQKMYMTFGGAAEAIKSMTPKDMGLEETGRTESIAGYKCSEYIIRDKKETYEIWATSKLGRYMSFLDAQRSKGKTPAWVRLLIDNNLFPLRTVTRDRKGRERTRMEATKVEPTSLPDDIFAIPDGYTKFGLPNLGGLLKGLGQ